MRIPRLRGTFIHFNPFPRENVAHSNTKKGISQFIGESKRYIALVIVFIAVLFAAVLVFRIIG